MFDESSHALMDHRPGDLDPIELEPLGLGCLEICHAGFQLHFECRGCTPGHEMLLSFQDLP